MKETQEKNWDIPLTVITKETVQAKRRDNEEKKKKRLLQILDKKKITKMTAFSKQMFNF